jgi:site-specific recombinase XerD
MLRNMDPIPLPPAFESLVDEYKASYMAARNLAEKTRIEYETDIRQFLSFLAGIPLSNIEGIAPGHIRAFLARLDRLGLAGSSRRRKFSVVRSFTKWLKDANYIANNPTLQIEAPRTGEKEPKVLTKEEYQRLLSLVQKPRDRAIIQLVLQTGIRLSEVYRLNRSDVKVPKKINKEAFGEMRILGKGRKERVLVLNYKICEALNAWLAVRPEVETDALFVSKKQQRLSKRQIQNVVYKYFERAGIDKACVHTLRHTMATHHYAMGTDILTLKEILGHENLETTTIYITLAKKQQAHYMQQNAL